MSDTPVTPVVVTPVVPATPVAATPSKAETFVLDIVGALTKLDSTTLQNDYNEVVLGIQDVQKIVAALKELDTIKSAL